MNDYSKMIDEIIANKEVSDLNNSEKKEIIKILNLMSFDDDNYINYLIRLTPEVGIHQFVLMIKSLNEHTQKEYVSKFFTISELKISDKSKLLRRSLSLIQELLESKLRDELIWFSVHHLINFINKNFKKDKQKIIAKLIYDSWFKKFGNLFYQIQQDKSFITENEFTEIIKVLISYLFYRDKDFEVNSKYQVEFLKWLANSIYHYQINDVELIGIKFHIRKWPLETVRKAISENSIKDKFNNFFEGFNPDSENLNVSSLAEVNQNIREVSKDSVPEEKNEHIIEKRKINHDPVKELLNYSKSIQRLTNIFRDYLLELDETKNKKEELELHLKTTNCKNTELEEEIKKLVDENNSSRKEIEQLKNLVKLKEKDKSELLKKNKELESIVTDLHKKFNLEKNNLLEDFKNKIGSRLRVEFLDFSKIKLDGTENKITENLKIQLENIFNELKRNGIKF